MGSNGDSGDPVLKMVQIDKRFPGVHALSKVDFELRRGEVHCLLGENGAGKSTLIKILSGAYQPDSGEIYLHGKPVRIENPHDGQMMGISVVYQELNLVPVLSVAENMFLGRYPMTNGMVDWNRMYTEARTLLQELHADLDVRLAIRDFGVAQQQVVEISKALGLNASIIVMDEPTAALTDREIDELFRTINTLKAKGVSIIYISHRLEEVPVIGDRVTVLRDGELVGTRDVKGITQNDMIRMMIGRDLKEKFPKEKIERGGELLRVEGLGRGDAVNDVSFTLHKGEILGLSGLVGAGRTEVARLIFGADEHDRGKIFIEGEEAHISKPSDAIKYGIGFLTEDRKAQGLVLVLSVAHNVTLAAMEALFPNSPLINLGRERQQAEYYVKAMRVRTPSLYHRVQFLSGGNQQKTVVAKWLCSHSRILIFDEPTRGIDVGAKVEVYQLMNELVKEGAGIIMISSEMPEILGMSDRILVMHGGQVMGELSPREATEEKILRLAMGGIEDDGTN
jgi:ribose transport system ATP-binding protein